MNTATHANPTSAYATRVEAVALSYLQVGGESTNGLVVTGELTVISACSGTWQKAKSTYTVDTGLDENEAELAVLVLAVGLEVLADGNGLLDEHVEVLWDIGAKAFMRKMLA